MAACLLAAGCAAPEPGGGLAVAPGGAGSRLTSPVFEPGPSEDRFDSEEGPVVRVRSAMDADGVWTSTTAGPDETSVLTLRRGPDGVVLLLGLESGDRDVVCDPGLAIEPAGGVLPHRAETGCAIDGRRGTARAELVPLDGPTDTGGLWVRLTLEFEAFPVTARRRFDWRLSPAGGIAEERATLDVRVLGVPVRSNDRTMTRTGGSP